MATFNRRVSDALRSFGNARSNWGALTREAVTHFVDSGDAGYLTTMLQSLESEKGSGMQVSRWKGYVVKSTNVQLTTLKDGKVGYKRSAKFGDEVVEGRVKDDDTLAGDWWTFGKGTGDKGPQDVDALKKYLEGKTKDGAKVTPELAKLAQDMLDQFFAETEQQEAA